MSLGWDWVLRGAAREIRAVGMNWQLLPDNVTLLPPAPEDVPALSDPSEREGTAADARRNKGNKVASSKAAGNKECGWLTLFDLDRTCSQLGVIGDILWHLRTPCSLSVPTFSLLLNQDLNLQPCGVG